MREEAFRDWLEANGANTEAGGSTRCYAVRTVEAKLSELGFEQNTLEEILAADLFAELRGAIADLRRDFDRGGERYRILMPNSCLSWLGLSPARGLSCGAWWKSGGGAARCTG